MSPRCSGAVPRYGGEPRDRDAAPGRSASASTSCSSSAGWRRRAPAPRRSCSPARSGSATGMPRGATASPATARPGDARSSVDAAGAVRQPRRAQARGRARRVRDRPDGHDGARRRRVDRRLHRRPAAARRAPRLRARRGSWPARRVAPPRRPRHLDGADERPHADRRRRFPEPIDLAVIDVSFISLDKVLGPIASHARPGRPRSSPWSSRSSRRARAGRTAASSATRRSTARCSSGSSPRPRTLGLGTRDVIASPILGPEGNREFLVHLAPGPGCAEIGERIAEATAAAGT